MAAKQRSHALCGWPRAIAIRNFFQAEAKENARTNKIKSFKLSDGTTVTDQEGLEKSANEFYNRLFLAQDDTSPEVITVLVDRKVDDTMNERLCAPITFFFCGGKGVIY